MSSPSTNVVISGKLLRKRGGAENRGTRVSYIKGDLNLRLQEGDNLVLPFLANSLLHMSSFPHRTSPAAHVFGLVEEISVLPADVDQVGCPVEGPVEQLWRDAGVVGVDVKLEESESVLLLQVLKPTDGAVSVLPLDIYIC